MTNVEALKALYVALGGAETDVADCTTNTDVLNVISAKYQGSSDALTNVEALQNIVEVAGNIGGGGDLSIAKVTVVNNASDSYTLEAPVVVEVSTLGKMLATTSRSIESGSSSVEEVALYKGNAYAFTTDVYQITVAGNIEEDEHYGFIIKGDGTITVSNTSS